MKPTQKHFTKLLLTLFVASLIVTMSACAAVTSPTPTPTPLVTPTPAPILTPTPAPAPTPTDTPITGSATDFVAAVERALPSIVAIEIEYGPQGAPGQPSARGAAGTGWVLDKNGLIVTNEHVVASARTITISLNDGRKFTATAVQTNPEKDLAVVKVNAQNLPTAIIGDSSKLKLGQQVAAIGNALDLGIRVTTGVVSQLDVSISFQNNQKFTGLIETDASINPGNSGGVLINISGEVVGITNAGLEDPNSDPEDFGYAISINEALPVLKQLASQVP